ncbi:hypothetical protein [Streptomyces lydicus]|uniref:hypothetical protein n=1 Tax=Streptomyces lydicus TaxID=47763 RepID=UPI0037D7AD0F
MVRARSGRAAGKAGRKALAGGLDLSQVGIGIGVPASPGAAGSGHVSPSVVNAAPDCPTRGTGCGS